MPDLRDDDLRRLQDLISDDLWQVHIIQPQDRQPQLHQALVCLGIVLSLALARALRFGFQPREDLGVLLASVERFGLLGKNGKPFHQLPLVLSDMRPPLSRVHHREQRRARSLLDIVRVFDTVHRRGPVLAKLGLLVIGHDVLLQRIVEPPVLDDRHQKESGFASLERTIVPESFPDTVDKRLVCRIELLESLNRHFPASICQSPQRILDWFAGNLVALVQNDEMMCKELEEVVRILDPGEEPIPFVCTVNREPGGFPDVLPVKRRGEDDPEEAVAVLTDGVVLDGGDQPHSVARTIEFLDNMVLERGLKLAVDLPEKSFGFRAGKSGQK